MPYSDFTRDFGAIEGCNRRTQELKDEKAKHQKSSECTGVDCSICKRYDGYIAAEQPNLP